MCLTSMNNRDGDPYNYRLRCSQAIQHDFTRVMLFRAMVT